MEKESGLTDEQAAKLPRWALSYVRKIEADLASYKARQALQSGPVIHRPGRVTRGHWLVEESNVVKPGEGVYFWTGEGDMDWIEVRHSLDHRDEAVLVRGGMTNIVIQPAAGNGIIVEPADLPAFTRRRTQIMRDRTRAARVPFSEAK